jgi:L-amino acid N-acyltransferase YncA
VLIVAFRSGPGYSIPRKIWSTCVGSGRALVETAIEFARSLDGLTHVHLAVAESGQAARALYEHLGFRTWGTEPAAIRVGEVSVAEHHMVRALGPGAA